MRSRLISKTAAEMLAVGLTFVLPRVVLANTIELTSRPTTGDTVNWIQLALPSNYVTAPQNFTSTGGTTGYVSATSPLLIVEQCCIGLSGTFDGNFAPGNIVLGSVEILNRP
jgi:hypothetical protein